MISKRFNNILVGNIFLLVFLSILIIPLNLHAKGYPVEWAPKKIEQSINISGAEKEVDELQITVSLKFFLSETKSIS